MAVDSQSILARAKNTIEQYGAEFNDPATNSACRGIYLDSAGFERTMIFLREADQSLVVEEDDLIICCFDSCGKPVPGNENTFSYLVTLLDEFDTYDELTKRGGKAA